MPKFRKKPIVIEAEQFFPDKEPWPEGVRFDASDAEVPDSFFLETLEGNSNVTPGDWIITGIKGEKYPCKPDIFEATYERVAEAAASSQR